MANHKSALKRIKQALKSRERNRTAKAALRTIVKKFNAVVVKDSAEAKVVLAEAVPTIAKAASRGIIHKNTAARSISRLTKKLNKAATV